MQKLINVMALASFAVSGVVVAGGVYVYVNKDSIVDNVKSQVIKAATEGIGNAMGADLAGALVPSTEVPSDLPVPIPALPF